MSPYAAYGMIDSVDGDELTIDEVFGSSRKEPLEDALMVRFYHALAFDWLIRIENGKILHTVKLCIISVLSTTAPPFSRLYLAPLLT